MEINITPATRQIWQQTLNQLGSQARRLFMASVVTGMGRGGAAWAKRELGWDRTTVRKGLHELESGVVCFDNVGLRGRKGFAAKLPQLQDDLRAIGEASSQTDPTFRTTQLYRRLTAAEAKRQLLEKGYSEQDIPSERSLCRMLGKLGFKPRRVAKTKPLRKVPQTDAIFETVHRINAEADADPCTIRLFGVLENYWNGDPLTSVAKALGMAEGMTYKGVHPTAMLFEGAYPKGVKLDKKSMKPYEKCLQRLADLGKWFIRISSVTAAAMLSSMAI